MRKTCTKCKQEKSIDDFYVRNKRTMIRQCVCKECTKTRVKSQYDADRVRNNHFKRNYGITLEQHSEMFEQQDGRCACCGNTGDGKWSQLCVDHCHSTGTVRELLCRRCNMVLGEVNDDPTLLLTLAAYLQKHGSVSRTCLTPPGML